MVYNRDIVASYKQYKININEPCAADLSLNYDASMSRPHNARNDVKIPET